MSSKQSPIKAQPSFSDSAGQRAQLKAKVLVIGAGPVGVAVAELLTRAGITTIGLASRDTASVDQVKQRLASFSSDLDLSTYNVAISSDNVHDIVKDYDCIAYTGLDFSTLYVVNDACYFLKKPLVFGAITALEGQATVFLPDQGCYRCIFREPPRRDLAAGIEAGTASDLLGEAVGRWLTEQVLSLVGGVGEALHGRLWQWEANATLSE